MSVTDDVGSHRIAGFHQVAVIRGFCFVAVAGARRSGNIAVNGNAMSGRSGGQQQEAKSSGRRDEAPSTRLRGRSSARPHEVGLAPCLQSRLAAMLPSQAGSVLVLPLPGWRGGMRGPVRESNTEAGLVACEASAGKLCRSVAWRGGV